MKDNIILENDNLILKPLAYLKPEELSSEAVIKIADDYDIAKYVGHQFPSPYTIKDAEDYFGICKISWISEKEYVFAIFRKSDNEYMGNIGFALNKEDKVVSNIGYWLGKKYAGNGYMTQAVKIMLDFCFNELKVRKIEAYVFEGNIASQKVLENNGFIKEGLRRKKHMLRDGEILDDMCYGLLKEEYKK